MMRVLSLVMVVLLVGAVAVSNAADNKKKPVKKKKVAPVSAAELEFKDLDKNNDGKLSLAEFSTGKPDAKSAARKFKFADKDADGFISKDEYLATKPPPVPGQDAAGTTKRGGKKGR